MKLFQLKTYSFYDFEFQSFKEMSKCHRMFANSEFLDFWLLNLLSDLLVFLSKSCIGC